MSTTYHALAVGELDGNLEFLEQLTLDRDLLEGHEGDHGSGFGDVSVQSTDAAGLDREDAFLFGLEDERNEGLDAGSRVLLARARQTGG